jgi:hypothetical protein
MGTTLTALQADSGFSYEIVLAIEGYPTIITSGSTAAALTAWAAATDFTAAIGGLVYDGALRQRLDPWKPEPEVGRATFKITGTDAETIGALALKTASSDPTDESTLVTAIDNNDTIITVTSGSPFTAPGTAFLGCERFIYAGKLGAGLTTVTRGTCHPFSVDGGTANRFGRYHRIDTVNSGVTIPPKVTQECTRWRGKWVGAWLHRKTASGVLDVKAQAHLIFAGRITRVLDGDDGSTTIEADDVRGAIKEKVLFEQQFSAKAKEGVFLAVGEQFEATSNQSAGNLAPSPLVVVSGTPASDYEIQTGYVTIEDLLTAINAWLAQGLADVAIYGVHTLDLVDTDAGKRVRFASKFTAAVTVQCFVRVTLPEKVCTFLGVVAPSTNAVQNAGPGSTQLPLDGDVADNPPYRVLLGQQADTITGTGYLISTDQERGAFVNQSTTFPESFLAFDTVAAGDWGILDIGGKFRLIARYLGGGEFDYVNFARELSPAGTPRLDHVGLFYDDPGDLVIKQIVLLEDTLSNLVLKLLTSTGTSAYNHATYDAYDVQLGAGIPYELLGDNFEASLQSLEQSSAGGPSFVMLEKPTRLTEVLAADQMLRLASIIWKNQTLQVTAWQTATSTLAVHDFTEANKTSSLGNDPQRSPLELSDQFLKNIVKIEYGRAPDGTYRDTINITDIGSVNENGGHAVTISAQNSVGGELAIGQDVEQLAEGLLAKLPLLSRPLRVIRRTISQQLFEDVAPGDQCTVTDLYARHPNGTRGISGHPGIIIEHARNFATGFGEVLIALSTDDRSSSYCPCAEVDMTYTSGAFTNGYDDANKKLHFQANRHSNSDDSPTTDIGSFAVNDEITIVEIDPATAASPRSWDRTITAVATNEITFSGGSLTGYTSAEKYRILSRYYTTAVATQKTDTYQADDADELIQNVAAPYQYGIWFIPPGSTLTNSNPETDLPSRHATLAYADGAPLDTGYEDDLIRAQNNFIHCKSALVAPQLFDEACIVAAGSGFYLIDEIPIFVGKQKLVGTQRLLTIAPFARINTAGSKSLRVRLSRNGAAGDTNNGATTSSPYNEVTFTLASTTWGTSTAQTLSISPLAYGGSGVCYLIVEAEPTVEYRGMAQLQLGKGSA